MRDGPGGLLIRFGSLVMLAVLPMAVGTSCASCEAKCVGPHAEISVSHEVSEVTVCSDEGTCTTQAFGPAAADTMSRSFTVIVAADDSGKLPISVSGKRVDGSLIDVIGLVATPSKGDCGCEGPARVFVDATGGHLYSAG